MYARCRGGRESWQRKWTPYVTCCEPLGARVPLRKIPTVMECTRSAILILGRQILREVDDTLQKICQLTGHVRDEWGKLKASVKA